MRRSLGALAAAGVAVLGVLPSCLVAQQDSAPPPRPPAPILARDSLSFSVTVTGDVLRRLPVDDARQAFGFAPGVVFRDKTVGLPEAADFSVRGSSLGDVAVYVDGAPARFELLGGPALSIGANAVDRLTLTAGVPDVLAADARGGVLGYVTRSGGSRFNGGLDAHTDEPFGGRSSAGFNRFEAAAGGPLALAGRLTWFAAGTLQGQRGQYRGSGAADQPAYALGGADTLVTDGAASTAVMLPRYVVSTGLVRPLDWTTLRRAHAKLAYAYGSGSAVSLTLLGSDVTRRFDPGQLLGDPLLYQGAEARSRLAVLNWSHVVSTGDGDGGDATVRVGVNLSLGEEREARGLLDSASEAATRDPALGIDLSGFSYAGADLIPNPLTEQIIRNIRTNSGLRTPYLNRTDLRNSQPYRFNPYGMASGWPTSGMDGSLSLLWERRWNGRILVEWARGRHRVTAGLDATRTSLSYYTSGLLTQIDMDAILAQPRRSGAFLEERFAAGGAVLEVGARYDHYNPDALFSQVPGRTFTDPRWSPLAATDDTAYANSLARVFVSGRGQGFLSPRLRLAYAAAAGTVIHAAAGRQVEPPTWHALLIGTNNDLSFTNVSSAFGRDVDYATSTLLELGVRQRLSGRLTGDLTAFHKTAITPYGFRFQPYDDPANPGRTLNVNSLTRLSGDAIGGEATLDWQVGDAGSVSAAYSLVKGENDFSGPSGSGITTQQLAAVADVRAPREWAWLGDVEGTATLRLTSGLPYTLLENTGAGVTAPGDYFLFGLSAIGPARLPWTRSLDLRLAKHVVAGGLDWTVFADGRNVLNVTNHLGAYAETGGDSNDAFRQRLLSPEFANLANEAAGQPVSMLGADGSIDVRDCTQWDPSITERANCVALQRVETRFGNGDKVYTLAEQARALTAYFDAFFGAWRFHGPGRTVRVGLSLAF